MVKFSLGPELLADPAIKEAYLGVARGPSESSVQKVPHFAGLSAPAAHSIGCTAPRSYSWGMGEATEASVRLRAVLAEHGAELNDVLLRYAACNPEYSVPLPAETPRVQAIST